jgi:hypothetical protein
VHGGWQDDGTGARIPLQEADVGDPCDPFQPGLCVEQPLLALFARRDVADGGPPVALTADPMGLETSVETDPARDALALA